MRQQRGNAKQSDTVELWIHHQTNYVVEICYVSGATILEFPIGCFAVDSRRRHSRHSHQAYM